MINLIISITGTYVTVANLFLDFGAYFSFLEEWATGLLFFSVIIIMLFFWLFQKLFKKWQEKMRIESKKEAGARAGNAIAYSQAQETAVAEAAKDLRK